MFKFVTKSLGKNKKKKAKSAKKPKNKPLVWLETDDQPKPDKNATETKQNNVNAGAASASTSQSEASGSEPSEREQLIKDAMAIHREKKKILDDLPPLLRSKLTAMAMAIYIKQRSKDKKN